MNPERVGMVWVGLILCLLATGGDQGGFPLGWLFLPGVPLLVFGVARWQPWRSLVWA